METNLIKTLIFSTKSLYVLTIMFHDGDVIRHWLYNKEIISDIR